MQRGKKQSPFIGRRVALVDEAGPILYSRYRDVSEILIDGGCMLQAAVNEQQPAYMSSAALFNEQTMATKELCGSNSKKRQAADAQEPAAAAAVNGTADAGEQPPSKKSKKDKKKQQEEAAAAAAAQTVPQPKQAEAAANGVLDNGIEAVRLRKEEKARKKREKQAKRAAELAAEAAAAAAAGGQQQDSAQQQQEAEAGQPEQQPQAEDKGNAEEAAHIRSVLGFTASAAPAAAAAPAPAAAKAAPAASFAFNFSGLSGLPAAERIAAETEAKLAAIKAVDSADKDGFVPKRVFVGGMPYSYSREQVAEYWGWCGEIESLDMLTFPDSGRFRGIVFITFESQEGADAALGYDGEQLEGQTLKVERCKAAAVAKHMKESVTAAGRGAQHKQQQQQQEQPDAAAPAARQQPAAAAAAGGGGSSGPGKTPGYNVAYVGNIAFEAGPEDIQALFADCGVTKVRLHTDKNTGKSKGYAHVHFADEQGLDRALGMSGSQLHGRGIKVSYGQPKKN